ncbi:putative isomerase BH0283-like protein [Cucumis melo var. makuwa]|uniref:Isomerase BH0283-like protein n=1 Tax=Cucumis melo var. makuwa TaxID=1194695 RepID=A0A5A7USG4_CUCMM|nr:putative isomerase BH0283-like protein [Cucumis melo var. makuwa]
MAKKPVKYFVVDAFTESAFKGNPAAVCLLEEERDEKWLKDLAAEFNISQTCYLIPLNNKQQTGDSIKPPKFSLRWFTPVELCGHATLAAAHILFSAGLVNSNIIEFSTRSGILTAKKVPDVKLLEVSNVHNNGESQDSYFIELDLPAIQTVDLDSAADVSSISKALNVASIVDIKLCNVKFNNLLVVLPSDREVVDFQPNYDEIRKLPGTGLIITGASSAESDFDFYTRYFCPKFGIYEDPVCGSAHCALAVYWAQKLGKSDFVAFMASPRSGILHIHMDEQEQRVLLGGKAITMMEGVVLV